MPDFKIIWNKYEIDQMHFLRYLVASRDIEPGTTILLDKPLAVGPHAGGALQCISCGFGVLISLNYVCKL